MVVKHGKHRLVGFVDLGEGHDLMTSHCGMLNLHEILATGLKSATRTPLTRYAPTSLFKFSLLASIHFTECLLLTLFLRHQDYSSLVIISPVLMTLRCYNQGSILAVVRSSETTTKSYGRVSKITHSSGGRVTFKE